MQLNDRSPAKGRKSLILTWLHRFSAFLYAWILNSAIGRYLTGYRKTSEALEDGNLHRIFHSRKKRSERVTFRARRGIAAMLENSIFCRAFTSLEHMLLRASINSYGIFFLFFGCYSIVAYYVSLGFSLRVPDPIELFVGGLMVLASLPLFASTRSLAHTLRTGNLMRMFIFRMLGVAEERFHSYTEKGKEQYLVSIFAALLFGSLTFRVPVYVILGGLGLLLMTRMILRDPEVGMLLSVAWCPFTVLFDRPTMALAVVVGMTLFSFLIKVLCGKRSFRWELTDGVLLLFMLLYLLGGVISRGGQASFKSALTYVLLLSIYFIVSNLVRSKESVKRICGALLLSGTAVALYGLWQYFFAQIEIAYVDLSLFSDLGGRAYSTWENPNMLAEYLALLLPLAMARMLCSKRPLHGFGHTVCFFLTAICLIITWSRGAWLGALISLLLLILCMSHRSLSFLILAALPAGVLLPMLPERVLRRFLSIGNFADTSVRYRLHLWEGIGRMLQDHWLGGVGVGEVAFRRVYADYALPGIETAMHSHSLYLQILCQLGVVGLIVFALLLLTWLRRALEFYRYSELRETKLTVLGGVAAVAALLVMGLFDDVFYNYRIFFLFFAMMGLVTAGVRVGEEDAQRSYNPIDDERTQGEITFRFYKTF